MDSKVEVVGDEGAVQGLMSNAKLRHLDRDLPELPVHSTALTTQNFSIGDLLTQAIDKGLPVETMERLLAMAEHLEAKYAKAQYDTAMQAFQAQCPVIAKTKAVYTNDGRLAYKYAPIEAIVSQVKELLATNGFSYTIQTDTTESHVTAICVSKHSLGHSEASSFRVPLSSGTKMMNASQVVAAALTFAKRYAFCNAFGILTGEEDTDSKVIEDTPSLITPEQVAKLRSLLASTAYTEEQMCHSCNVETITQLTSAQAYAIILRLEKHIASS